MIVMCDNRYNVEEDFIDLEDLDDDEYIFTIDANGDYINIIKEELLEAELEQLDVLFDELEQLEQEDNYY